MKYVRKHVVQSAGGNVMKPIIRKRGNTNQTLAKKYVYRAHKDRNRLVKFVSAGILLVLPVVAYAVPDSSGETKQSIEAESSSSPESSTEIEGDRYVVPAQPSSAIKNSEAKRVEVFTNSKHGLHEGGSIVNIPRAEVFINDEPVPIPESGRVQEVISDQNSQTKVTIDLNNDGISRSIETDGSSRLKIRSSVKTKMDIDTKTRSP